MHSGYEFASDKVGHDYNFMVKINNNAVGKKYKNEGSILFQTVVSKFNLNCIKETLGADKAFLYNAMPKF